ncbi:MAG: hypothetical protein OHK0029_17500 [Armatimonadaceae bacterium]
MKRLVAIAAGVLGFLPLISLFPVSSAWAQSRSVVRQPAPFPKPPDSLETLLPDLYWNTERGPLLIVAPVNVRPAVQEHVLPGGAISRSAPPPLPEKGDGGYRLAALAEYFDHRVVPVGTLTVFAPAKMVVLHVPRGKPDIYADMSPQDLFKMLIASLTPAQWQRLGSTSGLGAGDLNRRQQEIFQSAISAQSHLQKWTGRGAEYPQSEQIPLTPAQKAGLRLRIQRKLDWEFRYGSNGTASIGIGFGNLGVGESRFQMVSLHDTHQDSSKTVALGAVIRETVASRAKNGHLAYDWSALDVRVSLTGAKTIGEIIERVRTATRVELYADRRYAAMPVYVRGDLARAGDILRALAYGVTGTYRRLGNAFLLTDDVEGVGTRQAKIALWLNQGVAELTALAEEQTKTFRSASVRDLIPWAADDPMAPNKAVQEKLDEFHRTRNQPLTEEEKRRGRRTLNIPVSELSPAAQQLVRQQVDSWNRGQSADPDRQELDSSAVLLKARSQLMFLVPGVGAAEVENLNFGAYNQDLFLDGPVPVPPALASFPETVPLRTDDRQRTLIVRVATSEEATQAVSRAHEKGFTRLWLAAEGISPEVVSAGVAAGQKAGVAVGAVVRVLRDGSRRSPLSDRTLLGETYSEYIQRRLTPSASTDNRQWLSEEQHGDWLRCDSPAAARAALERIKAIATIPGLSEITLRDMVPQGYQGTPELYGMRTPMAAGDLPFLGYTEEMRLAFLRKNSLDPIDLSPLTNGEYRTFTMIGSFGRMYNMSLPLLQDYGLFGKLGGGRITVNSVDAIELGARDSYDRWVLFRVETCRNFLAQFTKMLRATAPNLPVYLESLNAYSRNTGMYSRMESPEKAVNAVLPLPVSPEQRIASAGGGPLPTADVEARQYTDQIFFLTRYLPSAPSENTRRDFVQQVRYTLNRGNQKWDGIVLDMSLLPFTEALPLLNTLTPEAADTKPVQQSAGKPGN